MYMKSILSALVLLVFLSSCSKEKCDGLDEIHSFEKLVLRGPDSVSVKSGDTVVYLYLEVDQEFKSRKGERNCRSKDLAFKMEDAWDSGKFSLTCAQSVKIHGTLYSANTNLIPLSEQNRIVLNSLGSLVQSSIVLKLDSPLGGTTLEFTFKGETTKGKQFSARLSSVLHP